LNYDKVSDCELGNLATNRVDDVMTFNHNFYKTFPFWCGLVILSNLLLMSDCPVFGAFWWYHVICTLIGFIMILYSFVASSSE
ncbi:MAG: hypothetical protein ABF838_09865, partial [Lentilactobacillus hilgardii]